MYGDGIPGSTDVEMQLRTPKTKMQTLRCVLSGTIIVLAVLMPVVLAVFPVAVYAKSDAAATSTASGEILSRRMLSRDCEEDGPGGCRQLTAAAQPVGYEDLRLELDRLNQRGYELYKVQEAARVLTMSIGFGCLEAGAVPGFHVALMLLKNLVDMCIAGIMWPIGSLVTGYEDLSEAEWIFLYTFAATCGTIVSGAIASRMKVLPYFCYIAFNTGLIYPLVVRFFWRNKFRLRDGGKEYHDFAGASVVHLLAGACALVAVILVGPRHKVHSAHSFVFVFVGIMLLNYGWLGFNGGSVGQEAFTDLSQKPLFGRIWINTVLGGCSGLVVAFWWRSFLPQLVWLLAPCCGDTDRAKVLELLRWWREECQPDWELREFKDSFTVDSWPRTDFFGAGNGLLAGLVAVTGFCDVARRAEAIALGACGATVYCISSYCLLRTHAYREVLGHGCWWPWNWRCFACCRITLRHRRGERKDTRFWFDDVVDAISVHGASGVVGVCALPLLRRDWEQAGVQLCGALVVIGIGMGCTLLVLFPLRYLQDRDVWRRLRDHRRKHGGADPSSDKGWVDLMKGVTYGVFLSVSSHEEISGIDIVEFGTKALEYLQQLVSIIPESVKAAHEVKTQAAEAPGEEEIADGSTQTGSGMHPQDWTAPTDVPIDDGQLHPTDSGRARTGPMTLGKTVLPG